VLGAAPAAASLSSLHFAGLAVLAATALVVNAAAAGTVKPDSCPTNKPLVVDSYGTFENSADYGADGHVWALDAGTHFIQIWSLGGNAFCVKVHDIGTSTTFAGPSPEGTGNVRAGVSASFDGTVYMRYYGTLAPTVPTTGFIGDFDFRCSQDGTCTGSYFADSLYFSSVRHIDYGAFAFAAHAGACGTWSQTTSGDTGDIVCP